MNKKHTDPVDDSLDCITLISKSIQTLSEDLCLSLERRCSFSTYIYPEERLALLLQEVNKLCSELVIDSNAESFDSAYFSGIVFSAVTYFKNLPERSSTMLAINLGENIINYFHRQQGQKVTTVPSAIKVLPITEEENDALQYLSGLCFEKIIEENKATC